MTPLQIDAPHFCAGLVLRDDVCVEAAPILKWTIGKHSSSLLNYFARKNWNVTILSPNNNVDDANHPK